jgi:hypothetical protein
MASWDRVSLGLDASDPEGEHRPPYAAARERLHLADADRRERAAELESYLDHIEAVLEQWAERSGA